MKPLNSHEKIGELLPIQDSDFFSGSKGFVVITTHRLIILTEDKRGGSYWPLGNTDYVSKKGKWARHSDFFFQSKVEGSEEHHLQLRNKAERAMVKTLFLASKVFKEYEFEEEDYLKDPSDPAMAILDEVARVKRFSEALNVCSANAAALFKWLMLMVGLLMVVVLYLFFHLFCINLSLGLLIDW